jgi:hypothetical protein
VISGLDEAEAEYANLNVLFRLKPLLPDNLLASVHSLIQPRSVTAPSDNAAAHT